MSTTPASVAIAASDGVRLAARFHPPAAGAGDSAPAFVLGHGFTGHSGQPRVTRISEWLAGSGAPVLAIDFRGHGRSEGVSSVGVTETADVAAGVEWLRGWDPDRPVVALGFSMGASIVVRYAGTGGDCDAVVAVSGPGRWFERGTASMARVNQALETRIGRTILKYGFKVRIGPGWDELPAAPVQVARAVRVPLLVVHGDADSYFDLAHPRMLASAAPGARLWIEQGMGHAENGTTDELLARILSWARAVI